MDREKVIRGLESLRTRLLDMVMQDSIFALDVSMVANAIDLLKEKEAVAPIPYHRSDGTIFKYECRQCRTKIFKMDLFCRRCGQAVKWND